MWPRALKRFAIPLAAWALSACTYTVGYRADYLQPAPADIAQTGGSAAIAMSPGVEQAITDVKPSSYTGSASTIRFPVGKIVKETAVQVFGQSLKGGVISVSDIAGISGKDYLIEPTVTSFSYKFDQLHNLGFAITPKVSIMIQIRVRDARGTLILDHVYSQADYAKGTYMASVEPQEKVNRALHEAVQHIMFDAAHDLSAVVSATASAVVQ